MMRHPKRRNQRGNTMVEFALVSVFLIPLLLGTVNVGMNLSRSIQVTQVSRDTGHMYVRFVDFTEAGNKDIIVRLAQGLGMTRDGGQGQVVLSKLMYVGEDECDAASLTLAECSNYGFHVFAQRVYIGNRSVGASHFGQPPDDLLDDKGEIGAMDYLTDPRTRAYNFHQLLPLESGEFAYVSEAIFDAPEFDFPGFFDDSRLYARTIF